MKSLFFYGFTAAIVLSLGLLTMIGCSSDDGRSDDDDADDDSADDDTQPSLPSCAEVGGSGVSIASVSPADGETKALRMPAIVVDFTGEIDSATFNENNVKLLQGSTQISLAFEANTGGSATATTRPIQELAYVTEYILKFEDLTDTEGNAVPACQTSFETKSKTAKIAVGVGNSMSVDEDGTLWTWGDPLSAAVAPHSGDGDSPEKLDLGAEVIAIGPSQHFGLAATEDGKVWAWGANNYGQLGQGTTDAVDGVVQVQMTLPSEVTITQFATGEYHVLALRSDGKVMAWGYNGAGQIGDNTTGNKATPIEVPDLTDVVEIGAGQGSQGGGAVDGGWSMALKSDKTVFGWGNNTSGQTITTNPMTPYFTTPQQVPVANIDSISVSGRFNGYGVAGDKTIWAWGNKSGGALGDGTCGLGEPMPPVQVSGAGGSGTLEDAVQVAGGGAFALALLSDGTVLGWGNNLFGALGDGTQGETVECSDASSPNTQATPVQALNIATAVSIAACPDQGLILLADGSVWAAGYNSNDKLGVGDDAIELPDTDYVAVYTEVPGL